MTCTSQILGCRMLVHHCISIWILLKYSSIVSVDRSVELALYSAVVYWTTTVCSSLTVLHITANLALTNTPWSYFKLCHYMFWLLQYDQGKEEIHTKWLCFCRKWIHLKRYNFHPGKNFFILNVDKLLFFFKILSYFPKWTNAQTLIQ